MVDQMCTIYDPDWDEYHNAVMKDGKVFSLDKNGVLQPGRECLLKQGKLAGHMVQFFTGRYDRSGLRENDTSRWGYFSVCTGEIIVQPTYDYAYPCYGDRARVLKDGKYGFLNSEGKVVVEPIWDDTEYSFRRPLCWVRAYGRYGYINRDGAEVLAPQFEEAGSLKRIGADNDNPEYAALVKKDGSYGYIDGKGAYIHEPLFYDAREFWEAEQTPLGKWFAPVRMFQYLGRSSQGALSFDKWFLMDKKGGYVGSEDLAFDNIGIPGSVRIGQVRDRKRKLVGGKYLSFYPVKKGNQWGLLSPNLEVLLPADGQRYVVYEDVKIYIKKGRTTSTRQL